MNTLPKTIYRVLKYTGFEKDAVYETFKDTGKITIGTCSNPLEFNDMDSLIEMSSKNKLRYPIIRRTAFCFTGNISRELWEAKGATFAIGLSTDTDILAQIKNIYNLTLSKIEYQERTQIPDNLTDEDIERESPDAQSWIEKVITTKLKKFEYENEFRLWGILPDKYKKDCRAKILLQNKCITEIIIGSEMDKVVKKETIGFCERYISH